MTQAAARLWATKPDELFERFIERAEALLSAEKAVNVQTADASRQAALIATISTQSRTIEDLSAACATLHEQLEAQQATALAQNRDQQLKLEAIETRLAADAARLQDLEVRLRQFQESTSWRVTKPLRWIRRTAGTTR